ncbi:MAG: hypothetical protein J4G10_02620 [Alphaproteobacteria bacterium]|nr:hypothetical protein [Alphaproteobacteria bacterium]
MRFPGRKIGIHALGAFLLGLTGVALVTLEHPRFTLAREAAVEPPALTAMAPPADTRPPLRARRETSDAGAASGDGTQKEIDARTRRLLTLLAIGFLLEAGR